jgi:hypothetical protein
VVQGTNEGSTLVRCASDGKVEIKVQRQQNPVAPSFTPSMKIDIPLVCCAAQLPANAKEYLW